MTKAIPVLQKHFLGDEAEAPWFTSNATTQMTTASAGLSQVTASAGFRKVRQSPGVKP
jgi:hypothetical protein